MNSKTSNYAVGAYTSCAYTPSSHSISILSPTSPYNGVSSTVTAVYTTSSLVRNEHGRLIKQGSSQSYDSNDVQATVSLVDFRAIQVEGSHKYSTDELIDPESGQKKIRYIVVAIIAGWFCCLPLGLCAAFNAYRAKNAADKGDEQEADMFTSRATSLIIWTMFVGLCIILVSVLYVAVM